MPRSDGRTTRRRRRDAVEKGRHHPSWRRYKNVKTTAALLSTQLYKHHGGSGELQGWKDAVQRSEGTQERPDGRENRRGEHNGKNGGRSTSKMFDCDRGNWKCWIARWERYRILSGLHLRNAETRVSTFLHAMGREAEDVFTNRRQQPIFLHLTNTTSEKAIQSSRASG
uniref:Putative conserved protein with signal anchor n=1 Tax=Ixodes ricinus TaxID=34613 RepID=A0A6B0UZP9_IXORI